MNSFEVTLGKLCIKVQTDSEILFKYAMQMLRGNVADGNVITSKRATIIFASNDIRAIKEYQEYLPDQEVFTPCVLTRNGVVVSLESRKNIIICKNKAICIVKAHVKSANSFFYNYLFPVLQELLYQNHIFYIHGAGVYQVGVGSIFFVGPRGHGKSTLSLTYLLQKHKLLTDDTILVNSEDMSVCTLQRPLHVDPKLGEIFGMGQNVLNAPEYIPGSNRVELDVNDAFLGQSINFLEWPRAIILPQICQNELTSISGTVKSDGMVQLLSQIYPGCNNNTAAIHSFIEKLLDTPILSLRLGNNFFKNPAVVSELIAEELISEEVNR